MKLHGASPWYLLIFLHCDLVNRNLVTQCPIARRRTARSRFIVSPHFSVQLKYRCNVRPVPVSGLSAAHTQNPNSRMSVQMLDSQTVNNNLVCELLNNCAQSD